MIDALLVEEMASIFFKTYESHIEQDHVSWITSAAPYNTWSSKMEIWKNLSDSEKQEWRDKATVWLQDYKTKFPQHYDKVAANWKKIDW